MAVGPLVVGVSVSASKGEGVRETRFSARLLLFPPPFFLEQTHRTLTTDFNHPLNFPSNYNAHKINRIAQSTHLATMGVAWDCSLARRGARRKNTSSREADRAVAVVCRADMKRARGPSVEDELEVG